jgi:hypothetical protein
MCFQVSERILTTDRTDSIDQSELDPKWEGPFGQGWNRRHLRRGHVFQGRYKSIPVTGERASDPFQFRVVADYIHLNPARAGLAGRTNGKRVGYEWSRLPGYQRGKGHRGWCLSG